MYRLLIVTKDPRAQEMFASMEGFEAMGYKPPRLRQTVEEAIECMQKHHIDAIAVDKDETFTPLLPLLDAQHPAMPIFQIAATAEEQFSILKEVYQVLCQMHSDLSNDTYDEVYYFKQARERWMRKLISGMTPTRAALLTQMKLYRCTESPEASCLFARLSIPVDNTFLNDRWHYGSERLEMALHNFFGDEYDHLNLHIAMVSPQEVRVLACPKPEYTNDGQTLDAEPLVGYINDTIERVEDYLGLPMSLMEIRKLDGLTVLAADQHMV